MDKKHRIQEHALKQLEVDLPAPQNEEAILAEHAYGLIWHKVRDRKWVLGHEGTIIATIFHKPTKKYSLWFKAPILYKKLLQQIGHTYLFDSFEEAAIAAPDILQEHAASWCDAVLWLLFNKNAGQYYDDNDLEKTDD